MTPSITLDGRPTEVLLHHPRSSAKTYQFQIIDPITLLPLNLTPGAGNITDIVVLVKVSDDDDDVNALVTKKLTATGVALSTGPNAITAANGWFDLVFLDTEVADSYIFPDDAELVIGAKIYPQKCQVMHGVFHIHGETVRG